MVSAIAALALAINPQAPTDGFVQRPGVQIHYRVLGADKPMIVLSGGPGQDVRQMQAVYDHISSMRQCVLIDQRATGKSTLTKLDPSTINLAAYIGDVEAVRRALKLEKVSLIGHSWGAMLALAYAVEHPERVDELVLIGSGPFSYDQFEKLGDLMMFRMNLLTAKGPLNESQDLREVRPIFFDQRKAEEFIGQPRDGLVSTSVSQWLIPDLIERKYDVRPGAAKLRCRTLLLQGRFDMLYESMVFEMRDIIPGAQVRFIEKAGHFSWIEQPQAFFGELDTFLEGTGLRS